MTALPSTPNDAFGAIAHPLRRSLIDMLAQGERNVAGLAEPFNVSRPAISQHLRILLDAGLVAERRVGRERRYSLQPNALRPIAEWIAQYEAYWSNRLDALGTYLDANHES